MKILLLSLVFLLTTQVQADPNFDQKDGAKVTAVGFDDCCQSHQNSFSLTSPPLGKGPATPNTLKKKGSGPSAPAVDTDI